MPDQSLIEISIADQQLRLSAKQGCLVYPISTASLGVGQRNGSWQTPVGWHRIRACIGLNEPINRVFVGRRATPELYTVALAQQYPDRDWILTRILWLQGMEVGFNRGGEVDTMRRFIYIHGCPDSEPMSIPRSHGCIRMRNSDVLDLFTRVSPGTLVWIQPHSFQSIPCRLL